MANVNVNDFSSASQEANSVVLEETAVVFVNSAAANTVVNVEVDLPEFFQADSKYLVVIQNPATDSALTVKVKNKETLNGVDAFPELSSIAVPIGSVKAVVVEGFLLGTGGRLSVQNDTALGVSGGFTARVLIRKI